MDEVRQDERAVSEHSLIAELLEAFAPFLDLGPQRGAWGVISKKLDGMAPLTVTVTKAQMLAALNAAEKAKRASRDDRARAGPDMLSALNYYADQLCEGWCEQSPDCANFDDCGGCLARRVAYQVRTHPTLPEQLPEAGITIGEEG